jgi:hypothetical protein
MKRTFTEEEIKAGDLLDEAIEIESVPWRHGRKVRLVFVSGEDGANWAAWFDSHHEDGVTIDGPVTATRVHQVERTVKVWEDMP